MATNNHLDKHPSQIDNSNDYPEDYIISDDVRNRVKLMSSFSETGQQSIASHEPMTRQPMMRR